MINSTTMDAMTYLPQTATSLTVEQPTDCGVEIVDIQDEINSDVIDIGSKVDDEEMTNGEAMGKGLKNFIKEAFKAPFTNKDGKFSLGKTAFTIGLVAAGPIIASVAPFALSAALPVLAMTSLVYGGANLNQALNAKLDA